MQYKYAVMAIGVVSVSFAAIFIRLAEAPPLVIAAYRLCLASLILVPAAFVRSKEEIRRLSRREILMAALAGLFLALHFASWVTSLSYTSVATSVVLVTINPIFVAIASRLFFREKLHKQVVLGIAICLVGGLVITYGNWQLGSDPFLGSMLALLGALTAAGYLLIGRKLRKNMGILSYTSLVYSAAGIVLLITTLAQGYSLSGYSGNTYLMLVLLALVPQLIGHSSLNWSLRFVPATLVTVAVLGEPVGATIWAWLILHEYPSLIEISGYVLILAGIFLAFRQKKAPLDR